MTFEKVLEVLNSTSHASEIMDSLLQQHLDVSRRRLTAVMSRRLDSARSKMLVDAFERLSPRFRARLLLSPEVYELESLPVEGATEITPAIDGITNDAWYRLTMSCIRRETFISELEAKQSIEIKEDFITGESPDDVIWSPMGDYYAIRDKDEWKLKRNFVIGDVISVDFDSTIARRHEIRSGVLGKQWHEPGREQKKIVINKLQKALSIIDSAAPVYGALIRNFTRRVVVRFSQPDASEEIHVSSEHVPRHPGAIRMLNIDSITHPAVGCAEQLLHESVHNLIACWEDVNKNIFQSGARYRPVSPWSGNPIPNPSFAHAIFVYYACYKLFCGIDSVNESQLSFSDIDHVDARKKLFISGFLIKKPLHDLFVSNDLAPKAFRSAVDFVQSYMRSAH